MPLFNIQKWSALAPGLKDAGDWTQWLNTGLQPETVDKISPSAIPAGLRRRLSSQGKLAVSSAMTLLDADERLPVVFASRHGDVAETLKLLESLGNNEPLSPARFSMSVHNAVCGVLSIARRDTSAITAVSCSDDLLFAALTEVMCQLQEAPRVLCIMGDCPLPNPYQTLSAALDFPWALSFVVSRDDASFSLLPVSDVDVDVDQNTANPRDLISMLVGNTDSLLLDSGRWQLVRQAAANV